MAKVRFHKLPDGRRMAFRHHPASNGGPTIVFLPGYMSDMDGGKATAVFDWAASQGHGCLLLDYTGCGMSDGEFSDGSLSNWRGEILHLIGALEIGSAVIIGSSMGGWLMLTLGLALNDRLAGIVGIASAPDFTEWGRSDADKTLLESGQTVFDENPYGPEPTPMHPLFWRDGQSQLLLDSVIELNCPMRLIHGQKDRDVPWEITMQLAAAARSDDIQVTLIKDGDHRLSRESDIRILLAQIADVIERASGDSL